MNDQSFDDAVMRISSHKKCEYDIEAFYFIRDCLNSAMKKKNLDSGPRHVSGAELCEEVKQYALAEFGPMAAFMMRKWNMRTSSDIGEIVYLLIIEGVFGKSGEDRREDFDNIFSFEEVLTQPYAVPLSDFSPLKSKAKSRPKNS